MKNKIFALVLIPLLLTACGNSPSTMSNTTEPVNISSEQSAVTSTGNDSASILFYGDYVLEGNAPDEILYYDRIVFYPDGRCYVHYINTTDNDRTIDRGYYTYEYSFSTGSNKIGIGSTSGGTGNVLEIPVISENRTLLKFNNYVLKRVDEQ